MLSLSCYLNRRSKMYSINKIIFDPYLPVWKVDIGGPRYVLMFKIHTDPGLLWKS